MLLMVVALSVAMGLRMLPQALSHLLPLLLIRAPHAAQTAPLVAPPLALALVLILLPAAALVTGAAIALTEIEKKIETEIGIGTGTGTDAVRGTAGATVASLAAAQA